MGSAYPVTEREMMRYLLGELSAEETDRFEERYFTDDEVFDRLLIVKADLIDRYVHGQLNQEQTNNFNTFFLKSPNHRHEVALVRSLVNQSKPLAAPPAAVKRERASLIEKIERLFGASLTWARLAAAAFAGLLIFNSVWLMITNRRMQAELNALRAQQQTAIAREQELQQLVAALQSQNPLPVESPSPIASPAPATLPSPRNEPLLALVIPITLAPGQSRTAGALTELIIPVDATSQTELPARTRKIQLRLLLDRNFGYGSYAVALKNASNKTIQIRTGLRASGDAIVAEYSADNLKSGEYSATLSGIPAKGQSDEIADYPFRIMRR